MKIFVTGGCGFIGSNFILRQIKSNNCEIMNYDKLTYAGNAANLKSLSNNNNYSFFKGDICDFNSLKKAIYFFRPNWVVHFAAESHVDNSINEPNIFIKTNVEGTANLLGVSLSYFKGLTDSEKNYFKFLHVSTDEVFGSLGQKGYFNNDSNYSPNSPYSASKASSDHLVRAWHATYQLPTLITNCSNNYGPFQYPEKLIPLLVTNCLKNKSLPIYGDGKNIRDWIYVNDHCDAISLILKKGKIGNTYLIGGNNEINNNSIAEKICDIMDKIKPRENLTSYKELITYVEDRPGHDFRYAIDSSCIEKELGWKPAVNFDSGIKNTIKWYLENEEWWKKIIQKKKVL